MRSSRALLLLVPILAERAIAQQTRLRAPAGIRVEDLTWVQAERVLDTNTVVVIPLGAEAKEHGPQLRLKNDFVLAEYYADRVLKASRWSCIRR